MMETNKIAQFLILYFFLGVVHYPRNIGTSPIYFTPVSDICNTKEITAHPIGKIVSPNYPNDCKNKSLICELVLKIPPLKQLRMEIEQLKINNSKNCTQDVISITEYQRSESEARETRFCGRYFGLKIPVITGIGKIPKLLNDGDVVVRFITKGNTNGSKFLLRYELIDIPKNLDATFVKTKDLIVLVVPLFVVLAVSMIILECKRQRQTYKSTNPVRSEVENRYHSVGSSQNIQEEATTMNGTHRRGLEKESGATTSARAEVEPYHVTVLPVNRQPPSKHTGLKINTPQISLNGKPLDIVRAKKLSNRESGYVIPFKGNGAISCQEAQAIIPSRYTELDSNKREDRLMLNEARANGGFRKLLKGESVYVDMLPSAYTARQNLTKNE